jgi:hypothetical protein
MLKVRSSAMIGQQFLNRGMFLPALSKSPVGMSKFKDETWRF